MKLKSYFSGTVEAALVLARAEMGEDALLMNVRPTPPESRHLGAYEVVFGVAASEEPPAALVVAPKPAAAAAAVESASPENTSSAAQQIAQQMAQQMERMREEMERMFQSLEAENKPPARDARLDELLEEEIELGLAREVAHGRALEETFSVAPEPGKVVVLVGPPGAGKTTTLVQMAARFGLAAGRTTHIVSSDVFRIAAAEQLRKLSSLLGVGFDLVESTAELGQRIHAHREKDLILVDTPGLSSADMKDGTELAQWIASQGELDTHLVLSASMKPADMARCFDQYRAFRPRKLLFTRLDETSRYGALISLSARTGLPISFVTRGQRIPDDFEIASKELLMELVTNVVPETLSRGAAA